MTTGPTDGTKPRNIADRFRITLTTEYDRGSTSRQPCRCMFAPRKATMKHPDTVLLTSYPAGSVYRRESPRLTIKQIIRANWRWSAVIFGCVAVGICIVLAPLATIISMIWLALVWFFWAVCRVGARADSEFPCNHAADSDFGLEGVASGYGVIHCRCGRNRKIVRLK